MESKVQSRVLPLHKNAIKSCVLLLSWLNREKECFKMLNYVKKERILNNVIALL